MTCRSYRWMVLEAVEPKISVRLLSGEILLTDASFIDLDFQVMVKLGSRNIPYQGLFPDHNDDTAFYHFNYVGERGICCCEHFLHEQTNLTLVLSALRIVHYPEFVSLTNKQDAYLKRRAAEFELAYCNCCHAGSLNGDPVEHACDECKDDKYVKKFA